MHGTYNLPYFGVNKIRAKIQKNSEPDQLSKGD